MCEHLENPHKNVSCVYNCVKASLFKHELNVQDESSLRTLATKAVCLRMQEAWGKIHSFIPFFQARSNNNYSSISEADDKNFQLTTVPSLYLFLTIVSLVL